MGHLRHKALILGGAVLIVLVALALLSQLVRVPVTVFTPQEESDPQEVAEQKGRNAMLEAIDSQDLSSGSRQARMRMLEALSEE